MLQQTQVDRVIPKYELFIARFPTIRSLARASFREVLRAWLGLGYNGRALRLWRCARTIVADHGGTLPAEPWELERLPGIGSYTAAAVAAIAFGARLTVVDVNVARVLCRALAGGKRLPSLDLRALAAKALPRSCAGEWAQALMDLGAIYCRSTPRCDDCPARLACAFVRRKHKSHRDTSMPVRAGFSGSNRYYRGRVMRALSVRASLQIRALGREVKEGFAISDVPWLRRLLRGLERDGLIRIRRDRVRLP